MSREALFLKLVSNLHRLPSESRKQVRMMGGRNERVSLKIYKAARPQL